MFLYNLYAKFSSTLAGTIAPTVVGITSVIMPMFLGGIALYIVWIAYKIIQEQEIIMSEVVKTIGWLSLASFFIGTTGAYMDYVVPFFNELPESLTKNITSNDTDSINIVNRFWRSFNPAFDALKKLTKDYEWYHFFDWGAFAFNNLILKITQLLITFTVTLNLLICKFMLSLTLSVGTLFFALGCFPPTRNYLNLWIGQTFNYSLLSVFYVLSSNIVCTYITMKINQIQYVTDALALTWEIFVLSLILVAILGRISGLASGLAGGMGMQTSGGLGSAAGAIGAGAMGRKALGMAGKGALKAGGKIASKTYNAIKSVFGKLKGIGG